MFGFVAGFLSELARETGAWLDRILPAPRLRRTLRGWRRTRPFWAAMWVIAGGVEMVAIPLAPLPLMIKVGVGAMSAIGISVVLVAGGVFFLVKPEQRMFVSVVTAVASLTSMATTNLGGFGMGMMAGLVGSSLAFGWLPKPARDPGEGADPDPDPAPGAEAAAHGGAALPAGVPPVATARAERAAGGAGGGVAEGADRLPKGDKDRAAAAAAAAVRPAGGTGRRPRHARRRARTRGAVLFALSTALSAAMLPATASAATAEPGTGLFPFPWPTFSWPWDTDPGGTPSPSPSPSSSSPTGTGSGSGSGSGTSTPAPSASPSPGAFSKGTQVTLPCLTGVDTGGLPDPDIPEAESGTMPTDSGDLTALRPPIVIGKQPGRPRAAYPVNKVYPEVGADSLTAYGAIIHGATYLKTADGGRMKVLWVHADRLVADNYAFELRTGGQVQTIDVDLDIPQVDIYVTRLTGSITIPVINVSTPRICIGADIVPANLPIAVQLPKLSVTAVEAGQVLVDAETVGFTDLRAHTGKD